MKKAFSNTYVMAAIWALLLYLPNLYALYWSTITGGNFSGSIVNIHDHNVYLSSVRDGMNGEVWIGQLLFTTETDLPQPLHFVHASLFYRLIGWLFGLTNLPINLFYLVVGLLLAFIAFNAYSRLFTECLESHGQVKIATTFLFVFPGLLWINQILQEFPNAESYVPNNVLFAELWGNPSMNPITHNSYMPHFVAANIIVTLLFCSFLHVIRDNRTSYLLMSVYALIVAYLLPSLGILWLAIVSTVLVYLILVGRMSVSDVIPVILSFIPSGLMSIWSYSLAFRSDFWAKYIYANVIVNGTIDLPLLILHIGVFTPLIVWGSFKLLIFYDNKHLGHVIATIWLFWLFVLALASFPGSPRFMDGIYLPISILVTYIISNMHNVPNSVRKWLYTITTLLVIPGTLITYIYPWYGHLYLHFSDKRINLRSDDIWPIRLSITEMDALHWIKDNVGMNDVVVAGPIFSSFVPGFSGAKVYLGHIGRTIDFSQKLSAVQGINIVNRLPSIESDGSVWFVNTSHEIVSTPQKIYINDGSAHCAGADFDLGDVSILEYTNCKS
ncbi:MAG: hypothetical protein CL789_04630 [Chloroflexi bacterium]|nr:hypothetical protein [Chloroflexota bacterium]|tara:strand:+ start:4050 stop:5714 length:1665 start_codon:yes stop_codon:yes gene_type:complete